MFAVGTQIPPDYVLSVHSSKALIVEPVKGPNYMLADAVIQLAVAKGERHEVRLFEEIIKTSS